MNAMKLAALLKAVLESKKAVSFIYIPGTDLSYPC